MLDCKEITRAMLDYNKKERKKTRRKKKEEREGTGDGLY